MRTHTCLALAALGLAAAGLAAAPGAVRDAAGQDQGQGALHLKNARLVLKRTKPGKDPSHSVSVKGRFLPGELTLPVDPFRHDIRLHVDGIEVFRLPAASAREGLRHLGYGRYRYKQQDVPGAQADRMVIDLPRGKVSVRVKGRDLSDVLNKGPRDLNVALEMNGQLFDVRLDFATSGRRWSARQGKFSAPPGGIGSLPPDIEPRDDGGRITYVVLDAGEVSKRTIPYRIDARNEAQWRVLWNQHRDTAPPYVDFEREMVIGVFLGNRPTSGYSVTMRSIQRTDDDLDVSAIEGRPAANCVVAQVITAPYILVRVPRVAGAVRIAESVETYACDPR